VSEVPAPGSTYDWNSEEYADGPHTIQVKAIDATGNEGWSKTHTVTVKPQDRTAGDNVYATAALISQKGWPDGANAVVLARGDNGAYEDAVVAPALCKKYNAPLLYTDSANLSPETAAEIDRLFQNQNIKRVFIIGQSISAEIEKGLTEKGFTVSRIAGSDKYDTSAQVAQEVGALSKTAIIVSEYSYEDAISVSPASYTKQIPILLASGEDGFSANALPPQTQEALKSMGVESTIIIGDEKAVGADVEKWLAENGFNPRRIGGPDKYETSALIAKDPSFGLSPKEPFIVSTDERAYFTDGFAGGVLAARQAVAPVLLVSADEPLAPAVKSYLFSQDASQIHIIGSYNVITGYEYNPAK
jgi:putative cell wall-binding protein